MTDVDRARGVFLKAPFVREVGCTLEAVGDGYARCCLKLEGRHENALGMPMGGAVFTLADFAFGVASNFDRDVFLSTGADVHFLRRAKGKLLTAEAKQIRAGRRTCLFSVEVTDELGTEVAYMTFTGRWLQARKKPAGPAD